MLQQEEVWARMYILSQEGSQRKGLLEENKYYKEKEREKANVTEEIYYNDFSLTVMH